jgi:pyridoxine 4-dehydrogenase
VSPVSTSDTFAIGGETTVHRLGYGAMQLTGDGVWGEPEDREEAIRVLRRAVELGVDFIDTADSYGPFVAEELIREALHPYPEGLTIATKAGLTRAGPGDWRPVGRPEYLRQQCELSLRHLGLERIELYQLHRIDPKVPVAESLGELVKLQEEGKIHHNRKAEPLLDHCEQAGIGFIPWFPLATGELCKPGGPLDSIVHELDATPSQVALAWLLRRSPVMLPIPGTSTVAHLEDNLAAADIELSDEQFAQITQSVS